MERADSQQISRVIEAVKTSLADYNQTADFESFLKKPRGDSPRNDVAGMAGKRFLVSCEVEEGRKLAEGLVKMLRENAVFMHCINTGLTARAKGSSLLSTSGVKV